MKFKRILKCIGIFFFCFVLLFSAVILSYSKTVKAVAPVIAVGVSALASFLFASGVSLTTQNIANNASMSDTLNDLANQYSNSTGAPSLEDTIKSRDALNYYYNNKAGEAFISMGDSVAGWFNGFKSWFVQNFGLTNNNESVVVSETKISFESGDYPFYSSLSGFVNGKVPISAVPVVPGSTQIVTVNSNLILQYQFSAAYVAYGLTLMDVAVRSFNSQGQQLGQFVHPYYRANAQGTFDHIKVVFTENATYHQLATVFVPSDAGDYTITNYGMLLPVYTNELNINSIGLSGSLTDGYDDFDQALSDARTDAGEKGQIAIGVGDVSVDQPYTDESIADSILDKIIANTAEGVLVGGYADEREVEEENDVERVPTVAEIGEGIVIVDGLEDFFPFCIPFDLYEIIKILNVPAKAPKFNWKMNFGSTGISDYDIDIDLSPYETIAMIFRTLCIIAFLVFLTIKTRDLIRG